MKLRTLALLGGAAALVKWWRSRNADGAPAASGETSDAGEEQASPAAPGEDAPDGWTVVEVDEDDERG